jgi:hypothetical protein
MSSRVISELLERPWKLQAKKVGQPLGHLSRKALIDSHTGLEWHKGNIRGSRGIDF